MHLSAAGFFITLFDKETLKLYLNRGIYGFHMPPVLGEISTRSRHFAALADYGCSRKDTHVFFFQKREIVYGGQILGSENFGAFFLNGRYSPLGRKGGGTLFWDESNRRCYCKTELEGIFTRPDISNARDIKVCQPYILMFNDKLGLAGRAISSDQLYFAIGKYPFPLPTNSISGMSFCTMTPFETNTALELIKNDAVHTYSFADNVEVEIHENPIPFHPSYGLSSLDQVQNESHMEASVLANPLLLPAHLRPDDTTTLCRQVPISPFKPSQMDRADICYYNESFANGSLPTEVLELKNVPAGRTECMQAERYLQWLRKCAPNDWENIEIYLLAPAFRRTAIVSSEFQRQIHLVRI